MNNLIHADIFFFITSIAVIFFAVISIIASYYIIGILKDIKKISERVEKESELIKQDIQHFRETVQEEKKKVSHFFNRIVTTVIRRLIK